MAIYTKFLTDSMLAFGSVPFIAATAAASWVVIIITAKPGP